LDHMTNQAPVNMHNATASFFSLAMVWPMDIWDLIMFAVLL
jgi:hypothetical protein